MAHDTRARVCVCGGSGIWTRAGAWAGAGARCLSWPVAIAGVRDPVRAFPFMGGGGGAF